jgi:ABC-2 type transport system permease protein
MNTPQGSNDTIVRKGGVGSALIDGWVVSKRNLIKIKRVPDILVFVLISPIMFVLLFAYVFGGAIDPPGNIDYKEFLVPGIFVQTVVFGATFTGYGLADDMQKGIIDRFKSLPMSRSAVLVGRTTSDVFYNVITLVIMALTGLLVGWRIREGFVDAVLGFLLLLTFAYAISWIMAYVGLLVPSVEVVNNASFIVIMPLTFVSNAFVYEGSFSGVLRTFVEWNPVSTVALACRDLFGNLDPTVEIPDAWSMQHPVIYSLLWAVAIVAVFAPLSIRQYRLSTSK